MTSSAEFRLDVVLQEDCIQGLCELPDNSVHLILSDIPYGIGAEDWDVLHNNKNSALGGFSPAQSKTALFKRRGKPINGWSEADREIPLQYYEWCMSWAHQWVRILKPGGSAFVFPGRRFSHRCASAMEDSGFNFRDLLVWEKKSAAHRAQKVSSVLSRRKSSSDCETWDDWKLGNLRPIWEPIIWVSKPYTGTVTDTFLEHGVGAFNEVALLKYQNKPNNVFSLGFEKNEKKFHPHQKPLSLTKALIELTTFEGHIVLDPFCGSGTTLLAAKQLKRRFIGYEREADFFRSCLLRLNSSENTESNNDHSN